MKKYKLVVLGLIYVCIWGVGHGQVLQQLPGHPLPQIGVYDGEIPSSVSFQLVKDTRVQPVQSYSGALLPHAGIIEMIQNAAIVNRKFPGLSDARDLPLSVNGNLLSVDGFEVDFKIPNNPNDPGICATPSPEIVLPPNFRMPAGCPFVVPCDQAVNRDSYIPTPGGAITYIKLNWTVVRNGGASTNIDQARVDQLMTEVNNDFAPFNIQFCADPATFVEDAAMYNLNVGTEDATLKTTYGVTPNLVCNVYIVNVLSNPSAGGYARFPYDPFGGYNIRGGVVMGRSNSNLGTHTLAHELGHTFGLHHTFRGVDEVAACSNCYEGRDLPSGASSTGSTEGDWCEDTNPHPTNSYICGDAGTDGCAPGLAWLNSPVNNHMSYSFCTSTFTNQQAGRFHCMIDSYLNNWVAFGGGTCGAQPPTALFTGSPTTWQAPSFVTFTDQSIPPTLISTWEWDFDLTGIGGATPATFVGQNPPVVRYDSCDTAYTVRLIVSNINGADTLIRQNYINVLCPAGECDTLDQHWTNPVSSPTTYQYAAGNYVTGVPNSFGDIGFYEQYITPTPGVTTVGAIRLGLASFNDVDSSMRIQVVVYNDSAGVPQIGAGPIGGRGGIEPGADLGVPGGAFFTEVWVPLFNKVTIDSGAFHVGVEIFGQNAGSDRLLVLSSCGTAGCTPANQGQGNGFNHSFNGTFTNYLTGIGLDFDLNIIPMLGEWPAQPLLTSLGQVPGCDTTLLIVTDTVLFNSCITSMSVEFMNLGVTLSDTNIENLDTLFAFYDFAPPETLRFTTINNCGRTDTVQYLVNYTFNESPDPDFTVSPSNPVCAGAPGVNFTASPAGLANYTWDFGDGTIATSGASNTTSHTYATPGLYYVTLVATTAAGCSGEETKLDLVEVIDCSVNAPLAGFRQSPDSICVGSTVAYTDTSQAVPDPATNWLWDFGDGNFSLNQNPTHTYTTPGNYVVRLVASNSGGSDTALYVMRVLPNPCVLPMDIALAASALEQQVALSWSTSTSAANSRFLVERTTENGEFDLLAELPGNDAVRHDFIDVNALSGQPNLYRIRQLDANGNEFLSNIAQATLKDANPDWISIYPNPAPNGHVINVDALVEIDGSMQIQIIDLLGRTLTTISQQVSNGMAHFEVDSSSLTPGTYFVRVSHQGRTQVKKVVVR